MKTVFIVQKWEGWVGFIEVVDDLDLKISHDEFMETHFPDFMNDDMADDYSDKWLVWRDEVKSQGYQLADLDEMFIEWLLKEKGAKKVNYETFIVDEWKYNKE